MNLISDGLLVKPKDLNEKNTHSLGSTSIYMASHFRHNLSERNPSTAIIVNAPQQNPLNLKDGDEVIVHYLTFFDHSYEMHRGIMFGEERLWPISYYDVFAVIRDGELHPVGEYVIGEQVFEKEFTSSFLILPDGVGDKVNERQAVVLHPADGNKIGLERGDKVLLLPYSNYKIEYDGKVYLRFRESEVIALCR